MNEHCMPKQSFTFINIATICLAMLVIMPVRAEFSFQSSNLGEASSLSPASSQTEPEFLPVHDAFKTMLTLDGGNIIAQWQIADEYYMYRDRFQFYITGDDETGLGIPRFDHQGKKKHDEAFGDVEVYTHQVTITIPILKQFKEQFEIVAKFQGCADAGLCYPPTTFKQLFSATTASPLEVIINNRHSKPAHIIPAAQPVEPSQSMLSDGINNNSTEGLSALLQNASLFGIVGLCLLIGVGLTFTPCILPMIPILSSIIVGQNGKLTTSRGFVLSSIYVVGMASTYAAIGIIFAISGKRIVLYMQSPIILYSFAGIFIILALSMFGFYELQLPEKLRSKLDGFNQKQKGGTLIGVFIMGILAALLASPCVSAPLAGILLFISTANDVLLGGVALFCIGLGIGLPLIILGTTGTNILPKAGEWMNTVKSFFGVIMLALAAYFVKHLLPGPLMMIIWASLLIIPAVYMGAAHTLDANASGWQKLWKGLGIIMIIYGAALVVGGAGGGSNPLQPINLAKLSPATISTDTGLHFTRVTSNQELTLELTRAIKNQKPVMLDYYADWCIACVEMEHDAFLSDRVAQLLSSHHLIQVDLTNTDNAAELLDRFGLIGPPSILFFNRKGEENRRARIVGEMNTTQLTGHLQRHITL